MDYKSGLIFLAGWNTACICIGLSMGLIGIYQRRLQDQEDRERILEMLCERAIARIDHWKVKLDELCGRLQNCVDDDTTGVSTEPQSCDGDAAVDD